MSCSWFIRLRNAFFFLETEPPIINIRYGWSRSSNHFGLCSSMTFFWVIIKVKHFFMLFYYINAFNFFFLPSFLIPCTYASIESIDYILLSSFEPKAILVISSAKILCLQLLNLCCVFNISLFLSTNLLWSSLRQSTLISFFSK